MSQAYQDRLSGSERLVYLDPNKYQSLATRLGVNMFQVFVAKYYKRIKVLRITFLGVQELKPDKDAKSKWYMTKLSYEELKQLKVVSED